MFSTRLRALSVFVVLAAAGSGLLLAQSPQTVGTWVGVGTADNPFGNGAHVDVGDGHTLIVGGTAPDGAATNVVANFDTATNQFAIAGTLLSARTGHTATLLKDGRVLVTGGTTNSLVSTDIELFDPSTGSSTLVAQMAEPRRGHVAALLQNGNVLIAGGYTTGDVVLQSASTFDPATNSISPTPGGLKVARASASATSLIDGNVVVMGGTDGTNDLRSAEIFNPFSQSFSIVSTQLSVPVRGHSAVLLPNNGSVLIAGGTSNGVAQSAAELFLPAEFPDPFSWGIGQFAPTAAMSAARSSAIAGPTATEGYAVATGGGSNDVERYRFATIKTDKDDYPPGQTAIITGSGWQANEEVKLLFQEDPAVHDDYELTVTADGAGNIYHDTWAPEEHDLNVRFYLLALGQNSHRRAQITFTDSRTATAGSVTDNTVVVREPMTASITVTTAGSIGNDDWSSTRWTFNDAAATTGCADTPDHTNSGTFTESFSLVAPPTTGTFSVTFTPFQNVDCAGGGTTGGNANTPVTVSDIVVSKASTTTAINSDNPDPSVAAQAVSVQVSVSPSAPSTGVINEGTVTINATDGLTCTTGTVSNGVATCQITFATGGAKTITATYNGTNNYITSTSGNESHTVISPNSAPSVAANFTSVTVDEGTEATNAGTWSDANAADTVTLSASAGTATKLGTNASGTWTWSFNTTDGPSETQTVTITANDGNGGISQTSFSLTVDNVAPTVVLMGPASASEGQTKHYTFTVSDVPADTYNAGVASCGVGGSSPANYAVTGNSGSQSGSFDCSFGDGPATPTVSITFTDDDGSAGSDSKAVTVANLAPVVVLSGDSSANEGQTKHYTFTVSDVPADTYNAGVASCGVGSPANYAVTGNSGSQSGSFDCSFPDGPATPMVSITFTDDDGSAGSDNKEVTVANLAPVVVLSGDSSANEGQTKHYTFTVSDVPADTYNAGVASCGVGLPANYAVTGNSGNQSGSFDCSFADGPATPMVSITFTDDDSSAGSDSKEVTVANLNPTATLSNNGPIFEGGSATISFSNQADASSVDLAAGFKYAYSCDGSTITVTTYFDASTSATMSCTFGDNGSKTVRGRIFDKDSGYTDYVTYVAVNNVVPINTGSSFTFNLYTGDATASVSFSDPGWLDTVSATWTGIAGTPTSFAGGSAPALTGISGASRKFIGCVADAIGVTISDDDGGSFSVQFAPANTLGVYTAAFMAPIKDGARNIVKLGNVIPVKVEVLDCHGNPVLNRTLTVLLVSGTTPEEILAGDNLTEGTSVSSADTGNQMRIADGHYMFNLATKGLKTGMPFTILIRDSALGTQNIATAAIELKK